MLHSERALFYSANMKEVTEAVAKVEVWKDVHSHRTPRPSCGRVMTLRTLRWRHTCRRPATFSSDEVGSRVDELTERALRAFQERAARRDSPVPHDG